MTKLKVWNHKTGDWDEREYAPNYPLEKMGVKVKPPGKQPDDLKLPLKKPDDDTSTKQSSFDQMAEEQWSKYFDDAPVTDYKPPYRGSYHSQGTYKPYTDEDKVPKRLYLAYGSNMHIPQMKQRCPDAAQVSTCKLYGWRLEFRGVADVIEREGAFVEGALWRVSKRDEDALDRYESYPSLYGKRYFSVKFSDGKTEQAMMYVMNAGQIHRPSVGYFKCIADGYFQWSLDPTTLYEALQRSAWMERGVKDKARKTASKYSSGALGLPISPKAAAQILRDVGAKHFKPQTNVVEDYLDGAW